MAGGSALINMKILVTGGAGFIGSHLVDRLLKEGHSVRVLDDFSSGKEENLNFTSGLSSRVYNLIRGDIRDFKTCQEACKGIDYVLHQAARRSVPKSLINPYEYNEVNINGTLNMLRASKEAGVKRFVFASSSSIYGERENFPEKESDMPLLISPYALTKLAGEYYCRIFSENHNLETVSLRYFNVFGPRQSLDDKYAVVIPKFITSLLKNEPPPIYGDGRQSRDFTFVANVVEANIKAMNTPHLRCGVFNIASGRDISILQLTAILKEIMNRDIEPIFLSPRPGDVQRTLADISKAEKLLGYTPICDFESGLKETIEWFRNNKPSGQ